MDKNSKKKDKLLQILAGAKIEGQNLLSKGRDIVRQGQIAVDFLNCTEDFISQIPDDSFLPTKTWDGQIASWTLWYERAGNANTAMQPAIQPLISVTTISANTTTDVFSWRIISSLPAVSQGPARRVYERYKHLLEDADLVNEIEAESLRLGLTSSQKAKDSVVSLLHQSKQSFEIPSLGEGSPAAILIPLREAINRALADILPKRPRQEKARSHREKVQSICKQCCYHHVDVREIDQLANEAYELNNQLSGGKNTPMTREEINELMHKGLLFLRTLLKILDPNRMRS